ncbi:hypothetical protein [Janibacter corallicola]|uniref:hypothetical protein n=1 Tax=Janibacter corallicola TaxID=415212 RepID=UPI0012ECF3E0|nr:hypothetical protein [Janibacter corallicola]
MTRSRGGRAVAAVLGITLALSACAGGDPAPSSSSGDARPTSTASPSSEEPTDVNPFNDDDLPAVDPGTPNTLPGDARKKTKEGALVFSRFYLEQMGEAIRTRESATLRKNSQECPECEEFIAWIDYGRLRGLTANRNPFTVEGVTILSSVAHAHEIRARVKVQDVVTKDPGGPTTRAVVPRLAPEEGVTTGPDGEETSVPTAPGLYSEVPGAYSAALSVAWVHGRWVVRGISFV